MCVSGAWQVIMPHVIMSGWQHREAIGLFFVWRLVADRPTTYTVRPTDAGSAPGEQHLHPAGRGLLGWLLRGSCDELNVAGTRTRRCGHCCGWHWGAALGPLPLYVPFSYKVTLCGQLCVDG